MSENNKQINNEQINNQHSDSHSKRIPAIAASLSAITPGLGQLYNGEIMKGLTGLLVTALSIPVFAWIAAHWVQSMPMVPLVAGVLIALCAYGYCIFDAWKSAMGKGESYSLYSFNRLPVYVGVSIFSLFFIFSNLKNYTETNLLRVFRTAGDSMAPTLKPRELFVGLMGYNKPGAEKKVTRGDIITFVNPNDRTKIFVKRVIGLPGDRLTMQHGKVTLGGSAITTTNTDRDSLVATEQLEKRTYSVRLPSRDQAPTEPVSITVPNGHAYVLGDNRAASTDSLSFGPIPLRDIIAKVAPVR